MIKLPDEKQSLIADCQADIEDLKRSIDRCDAIGTSDYLHHLQSRLKRQYLALESLESEVQRLNPTAQPVSDGCNVPEGWKLVPLIAFPSQWAAGQKAFDSAGINKVDAVYKAMVAAAPGGQDD